MPVKSSMLSGNYSLLLQSHYTTILTHAGDWGANQVFDAVGQRQPPLNRPDAARRPRRHRCHPQRRQRWATRGAATLHSHRPHPRLFTPPCTCTLTPSHCWVLYWGVADFPNHPTGAACLTCPTRLSAHLTSMHTISPCTPSAVSSPCKPPFTGADAQRPPTPFDTAIYSYHLYSTLHTALPRYGCSACPTRRSARQWLTGWRSRRRRFALPI